MTHKKRSVHPWDCTYTLLRIIYSISLRSENVNCDIAEFRGIMAGKPLGAGPRAWAKPVQAPDRQANRDPKAAAGAGAIFTKTWGHACAGGAEIPRWQEK
jgi:hypothetical protein